MVRSFDKLIGDRPLSIQVGKLAQQANGSVVVRYGDTIVLVTACCSPESRENLSFIPLTVDYEEKLYAIGKIPGSFIRREGRPTEQAVLADRLIDRSLRPLLSKEFGREVQVIVTVLSADQKNAPDVCALIGASAALTISDIPFAGPISAVRIGYLDGDFVLNPTLLQVEDSLIDLVVASTAQSIVMVEAGAKEASEKILMEAIKLGHKANQDIIQLQKELQESCGKPKLEIEPKDVDYQLVADVTSALEGKLEQSLAQSDRIQRGQAVGLIRSELVNRLGETYPQDDIIHVFESQLKAAARQRILQQRQHLDGRQAGEIRPISSEVGLLPRTHGSGLFSRGRTQVLTIATLGSVSREQLLDNLGIAETKRFMHHYNFAPFSSGEVRRRGTPGRREIGHGALVERAIIPVLPAESDFPYTIRLVSEVLSSDGSTSMASTCGATLSLMDAGVPIKAPVAGIAMGLVAGEDGDYVLLSDIEGIEDAYGDMDFKITGTAQGITALQLDIKLKGMDSDILSEALDQARQVRLDILEKMSQTISHSRPELSPLAPRIYSLSIDPRKIGMVIGPGGRTIRSIIDETKSTIDVKDDGTVLVGSLDEEGAQKAISKIELLIREAKIGDIYTGKVTRLLNFGAMVEILPGKEGLVHVSQIADHYVEKVSDVVKVGDELTVKVIEIDDSGRINLSRKALFHEKPLGVSSRSRGSATFGRGEHKGTRRYN
ncbi:MAG: polyribonucleotide nucleotidyltransferase [Dehalococcoidia bacterium]|nr:polyribonucleotide nucleotidyltransferase [Dehalococcoidia bacterium]